MLKHTSDQDFVGKSISAILPPFGDLPTQNSVSTLLTELLSCQNRWCFAKLLTRDCRVLPVVLLPASAPVVAASAYTQSSEPGAMLHVQVHDLVNKDVLLVLDSSFLIRHATATITMLLGRSAEEVVGKHITHLIPDFSAELALKQQDDTTTDRSRETFLAIHPEDLRRFSARYSNGTLFGVLVEVLRAMDSPPLAGDSSTTPITKETTYCARISVLDTGRQLTGRTLGALVDKVQMMTSPMGSGLVHHPDTTRSYAAIWSSAANLRLDPSRLRDEAELGSVSLEAMDTEAGATSAAQQARAIKSMRFSPSTAGNGSSSGGMTRRDTDSTSMPSSLPSSNVLRSLGSLPELPAVTTTAPSMTRAPTEPRPSPLPSPHFPSMDKSTSQAAAATAAALASGGTRSLKRRMSGAGPSSELGNSGNSAATAVARVPLPTSESDVALNRVVRDTLMILAWRMVPINPMFHGFQRRLLIGFSVVLCSLVATVVVLRQAQLDGNPMQLLSASSEIAVLMTEINIAAELVALCLPGSGAFAAAAWALPICTNPTPDARLTALSTTLAAASRSLINQARVIPTFSSHLPLNISVMQFMDANPAVSVPEMIPDIWQLIVKVSTSATNVATLFAAASAGGAGGANIAMSGDWQFLVANKNTIAAAAEAVTLGSYNAVVTSLTRVYAVIFGTAGAFIFLSLTVYCVWLLPELRVMNRARGRVFELLLQLPQRVASHMVYHVYRAMESSDGHEVNGSDESDSYLDLDLSLSTCTSVDDGEFAQPPIYVRPSTLVRGSGGPGALITQLQAPLRPRAATSGGQSSQLASSLASSGGGGGGASSFGRRPSADAVMELVGSKGNKPVAPRAFSLSRQGASGAPYPPPHLPPAGSDPLALSGDGHASQKRRRASKKVINYVARNSITPVVMFSVIFLSIVVPGALYLAINSLQSVTRVQAHFDQVNTSLTLLLAATRGASDAIAGTRVGWSHDRLVGSSTKIASTFQLVYAGILGLTEADTGVTAQALLERPFAAQPSMDALQALDHTVAIEPLPARIAALGSATGLQFVISGAISSLQSFAAASTLQPSSPSAAIASSPSLQQALVVQVQSVPMQLYLGLGLLLRLEMVGGLSDINAMLSNGYLIHLGMLGQLLVVFGGAWVMQARTRKEIKRNCFLLLMVPPSVIVKNREMAQYLRSVTTMLRGRLPAQALASALDNTVTAAPAAVGSKGVRRT
ncbi:hypothetical protein BC828DRAFT_376559 [Blastocladiella britannica]|nr:hypothetical protein BC828DRAFT_376559 [Blastocladiella britannica]